MGAARAQELRDLLLIAGRSNCVFTASGAVVTWLSASAVANILTRSVSIGWSGLPRLKRTPHGTVRSVIASQS